MWLSLAAGVVRSLGVIIIKSLWAGKANDSPQQVKNGNSELV